MKQNADGTVIFINIVQTYFPTTKGYVTRMHPGWQVITRACGFGDNPNIW